MESYSQRKARLEEMGYEVVDVDTEDELGGDAGFGILAGRGWKSWIGKGSQGRSMAGDPFAWLTHSRKGEILDGTSRIYRSASQTVLGAIGIRAHRQEISEIAAHLLRGEGEWRETKLAKHVQKAVDMADQHPDGYIRYKRDRARTSITHATSLARHIYDHARDSLQKERDGTETTREHEEEQFRREVQQDAQRVNSSTKSLDDLVFDAVEIMAEDGDQSAEAAMFSSGGESGDKAQGLGDVDGGGAEYTEEQAEKEAALFSVLAQTGGLEIRVLGELIPHFRGRQKFVGRPDPDGVPSGMALTRRLEDVQEEYLYKFLQNDPRTVQEFVDNGLPGLRRVDDEPRIQGDFTILVDVSSSMRHELWAARVVASAVAACAVEDGRTVRVIPFDTRIRSDQTVTVDPSSDRSPLLLLAEISSALNRAFGGMTGLNRALRRARASGVEGVSMEDDLFIITDGCDSHHSPARTEEGYSEDTFTTEGKVVFCHLMHKSGSVWHHFRYGLPDGMTKDTINGMNRDEVATYLRDCNFEATSETVTQDMMVRVWRLWREEHGYPSIAYFQADPSLPAEEFVKAITEAADAALDVND